MDPATARETLREHLRFLQELGFLCLEPPTGTTTSTGKPKAAPKLADQDEPKPVAQETLPDAEQVLAAPPQVKGEPEPTTETVSEPGYDDYGIEGPPIGGVPTGGPLAARPDWPAGLFARPARPNLVVAHPPRGPGLPGGESEDDDLLDDLLGSAGGSAGSGGTGQPAAETPDLFAEPDTNQAGETTPASKDQVSADAQTSGPIGEREGAEEEQQAAAEASAGSSLSFEDRVGRLSAVAREVAECRKCRLCESRTNVVPGQGNPAARVVFVGEGPGFHEDQQGLAFVGRAGQLLTDIIHAMQLTRDDVFICNVVKCRPPGNRAPAPDEMAACEPYLKRQLSILRPAVIIALGGVALKCLLRDPKLSITRIRGKWREYEGIPLMPTFHPAYLLRNPADKARVWEDIQKVMRVFGLTPPSAKKGADP